MTIPLCHLVGNSIRFVFAFRDVAGELADPTDVTCLVGLEGEDGESLAVVRESTGVYHADWDTTGLDAGTYRVRGNGSGAVIAADEVKVKLRASGLAN